MEKGVNEGKVTDEGEGNGYNWIVVVAFESRKKLPVKHRDTQTISNSEKFVTHKANSRGI